jgi:hypothetical protein
VSDPNAPPPNHTELYGRVGIPLSIALLVSGLGGFATDHVLLGSIFVPLGFFGLIAMVHLLNWHRFTTLHGLISVITALLISWIFLGYVLWTKPKEIIVHGPPTATDVENATAHITKALNDEKERADNAQSQLAAASKTLDELTKELNSARAQPGPRSPILALEDAQRWRIVKSMIEGLPETKQLGCQVLEAFDMRDQADFHRSADVWGEVQVPLFFAGWRFTQVTKAFFPPGVSITVAEKIGYAHECAIHLKELLDEVKIRPSTVTVDEGATELATCNDQCIGVTIAKLDTP